MVIALLIDIALGRSHSYNSHTLMFWKVSKTFLKEQGFVFSLHTRQASGTGKAEPWAELGPVPSLQLSNPGPWLSQLTCLLLGFYSSKIQMCEKMIFYNFF